jgi:hypothetical protein
MNIEQFRDKYRKKTYLGDGLYAQFDGYHFLLSCIRENGENMVGLDPPVFDAFLKYRKECYQDAENIEKEKHESDN